MLVKIRGVADVCDICAGPHSVLYCGDFARRAKTFSKLHGLKLNTNC